VHVYERYRPASQREVNDLVREHPFAILVSAVPGAAPTATHVPMLLPADHEPDAPLVGAVMRGHMGRANPHWRQLVDGPVLLVFSTSQAYVSPTSYDPGPTAPTLDYAAVHLTGRVELVGDPYVDPADRAGPPEPGTLGIVEATVEALESERSQRWDPHGSEELFAKILPRVAAFRITIDSQQAMFKLSQEKTPEVRARIRADLTSGPRLHHDVAGLMGKLDEVSS